MNAKVKQIRAWAMQGQTRREIIENARKKWGIGPAPCEKILNEAAGHVAAAATDPWPEEFHLGQALQRLHGLFQEARAAGDFAAALAAQKEIDKLLVLHRPVPLSGQEPPVEHAGEPPEWALLLQLIEQRLGHLAPGENFAVLIEAAAAQLEVQYRENKIGVIDGPGGGGRRLPLEGAERLKK